MIVKDDRLVGTVLYGDTADGSWYFDLLRKGEDISADTKGKTVNNGVMDVPSVLLAADVVDKDNIDKLLIDSGYLKREDVYKK